MRVRSVQVHDAAGRARRAGPARRGRAAGRRAQRAPARRRARRARARIASSYRLDVALEALAEIPPRVHVHHGTAERCSRGSCASATATRSCGSPSRSSRRAATASSCARARPSAADVVIDPAPPRHASAERMRLVERGAIAAIVHEPVRAETLGHLARRRDRARRAAGSSRARGSTSCARELERAHRRRRSARPGRPAAAASRGRRRSCRCSASSGAARSSTARARPRQLGARADAAAALEAQLGLEPVKVDDAALARFLEEQGRLVRVGDGLRSRPRRTSSARARRLECDGDRARPVPRPARRRPQDGAAPARALRRRRPDAPRRRRARPARVGHFA